MNSINSLPLLHKINLNFEGHLYTYSLVNEIEILKNNIIQKSDYNLHINTSFMTLLNYKDEQLIKKINSLHTVTKSNPRLHINSLQIVYS